MPLVAVLAVTAWVAVQAQSPTTPTGKGGASSATDLEVVEKVLAARKEYQKSLEVLRAHYIKAGDLEKARWAEEELRQYHRIPKHAFRLDLDVPPPSLPGNVNVQEANQLYMRALSYKDKGWNTDYIDNQRRAELLLQQLLTQHPQSDKISDAAFMLGDIYESKAYKQYRRAAMYYERCFQWNSKTQMEARIRAARLYDRQLAERARALELYKEVTTHETDPRRYQEAIKRLAELSGGK
jgi:hypothetical protein